MLVLVASTGCDRAFGLEEVDDQPGAREPGRWERVAVGDGHVCAIDIDQHLWCWGNNTNGQLGLGMGALAASPTQVGSATWRNVSAMSFTTCGVQTDGSGWCWGGNFSGQAGTDTTTLSVFEPLAIPGSWQSIVTAQQHTCGIRDNGRLACWGENFHGQLGTGDELGSPTPRDVSSSQTWRVVQPGLTHTCAVADDLRAYCWGDGSNGELGTGNYLDTSSTPKLVNVMRPWETLVGGNQHTCAKRDDGSIACWGSNSSGQLGDATITYSEVPTPVVSTETFRTLGAGMNHTCAASMRGDLFCWGNNTTGQAGGSQNLANGSTLTRINVESREWLQIAGSNDTTCAIASDHNMWCWGADIGASVETSVLVPTQVPGNWKKVSAGLISTCAIASDDSLACWGYNNGGAVGDGTRVQRTSPVTVSAGPWRDIVLANSHACGLDVNGVLYCWGSENYSLGDGARVRLEPTQITGIQWSAISIGSVHTLGIEAATGRLWCWGQTYNQQCTTASTSPLTPEPTTSAEVWTAIAAGGSHSCGISAGVTKCMGGNYSGELGDGTTVSRAQPLAVLGTNGLTKGAPVAGVSFTCAMQDSGLWCWGSNYNGETGTSATTLVTVPAQVPGMWRSASAGQSHACAVGVDGALWCWGANFRGQLGDGTVVTPPRGARYQLGSELVWDTVSAGANHTCAIKTDSSLWCWGGNEYGQLGIGTGTTSEPRFVE